VISHPDEKVMKSTIRGLFLPAIACLMLARPTVSADELRLLPSDISLAGSQATQRVIVTLEKNGKVVGERTDQARFTSSDPSVFVVDATGVVRAAGDGVATLVANIGEMRTEAKVLVRNMKAAAGPSFRNHVLPLMTRAGCNSGACHGALAGKGGLKLSLRGYDPEADHFVLTRQARGRRVDLVEPARSLLLLKPTMALRHGGGQKVDPGSADYQVLASWLAAGALGPRDADPRIQRIEVFPAAAELEPGDTLQLLVRARYSDGRVEDVTHWSRFSSSEDLVATVTNSGKVNVAGRGEAAISVWFSNQVAAARIASPQQAPIDPLVFANSPRKNLIDVLVLKKLEALRIPPSAPCTDADFIRRAYLDAAGILPSPEEVARFLADPSTDKRAHLVGALLERPEFVDYWAYKWSDLLLITTRRLPQPAVWAFYQHVRQSVADNKPWDRFARAVLTASGGTLGNGAANYFVLHKDVSDLTESTAVTFMGMSVTCCRCHNHPLEKWTQDQYWGMANLFARVGLKNGNRGEILVQPLATGDVAHPRRGVPMQPTPLDGMPLPLDSSMDRREYFVQWLTAPENPYFAKAHVNRVWRNFMGRGLVEAEDDLRQTNPPTNPELLEALARDFIDHKYDTKYLINLVMNSAAYQRSSTAVAGNAADDRFYSRYLIRRLPAEVILDAYSQVTGVSTPFTAISSNASDSASPYGGFPRGTRALQLPDSRVVSRFLDAFGRPERQQTCSCERQQDASVGQALHVNNGTTLNDKLRDKDSRIEAWLKEGRSDEETVRRLYLLALCRSPTSAEMARFTSILASAVGDKQSTRREALEDAFWAVLTSKEFLFNR
jgi:hypothetical protein